MSEMLSPKEITDLKRFYVVAIKQARGGDRRIAASLIQEFANLSLHPDAFDNMGGVPSALVQYVATCLSDWQNSDFKDAKRSFHVIRPAHGPKRAIDARHITALTEYCLLRNSKVTAVEAHETAAQLSGLTEDQVRALVQDQARESTRDNELSDVVAAEVENRSAATQSQQGQAKE